jgi:NADH:ubiquinone oxidoreductase subunit 6 (subunit J)
MILAFGALAGIYVLLGATVVAAAQVLIYIGAISVLILFAIMLTQTKGGPLPLVFHRQWWAGALAAFGVLGLLVVSIVNTDWPGKLADRLWTADRSDRAAALLRPALRSRHRGHRRPAYGGGGWRRLPGQAGAFGRSG